MTGFVPLEAKPFIKKIFVTILEIMTLELNQFKPSLSTTPKATPSSSPRLLGKF